jgi:hypothetical protein
VTSWLLINPIQYDQAKPNDYWARQGGQPEQAAEAPKETRRKPGRPRKIQPSDFTLTTTCVPLFLFFRFCNALADMPDITVYNIKTQGLSSRPSRKEATTGHQESQSQIVFQKCMIARPLT